MNLGSNLQNLRKEKNILQKEMADILGINRVTYTNYELGKREPDIETLIKIANFFDVTIDELVGRKTKVTPKPIYKSDLHEEIHKKIDLLSQRDLLFVKRIIDTMDAAIDKTKIVEEK